MATDEKQLITHSRQQCFKECRRKHYYAYELGIRKRTSAKALRMGTAFHLGIEHLVTSLEKSCDEIRGLYALCPEGFDELEWYYEQETVLRLVCAYQWRWEGHQVRTIQNEVSFRHPLVNPETGKLSQFYDEAGKTDGIVEMEDGRIAVRECKLLGDDIGVDSSLWKRLRIDQQITRYVWAGRQDGYSVDCVLYDVARKPTIKPSVIPSLDELGVKIVLDKDGNRVKTKDGSKWRQTGDAELGYVMKSRPMTPQEWGDKLTEDISKRPEFYFHRQEIARLDQDVREWQNEEWEFQQTLRDTQRKGHWFRTVNKNTCTYCEYFGICSTGGVVSETPDGFIKLSDVNPELRSEKHGNSNAAETFAAATDAAEFESPSDEPAYW